MERNPITWLDVLPALQLDNSVPFVTIDPGAKGQDPYNPETEGVVVSGGPAIRDDRGRIWSEPEVQRFVRVNLLDAQGFSYVLRFCRCNDPAGKNKLRDPDGLIGRHIHGHSIDSDRFELAQWCGRVARMERIRSRGAA